MDLQSQNKIISIAKEIKMPVEKDEFDEWGAHAETKERLRCKKDSGIPIKSLGNTTTLLRSDPRYASLCMNELSYRYMIGGEFVEDFHIMKIREEMEVRYMLERPFSEVQQAVMLVATERRFDPVKEYLNGLSWDGEARISRIMEDVFHADVTEFNQELLRKISRVWFASAAGRALFAGCKADGCLVLVGDKGTRKSTALNVLGGKWFSDSYLDIGGKDGKELIHQSGTWIWEIAEMYSLKGKSAENAKSFLTACSDDYRPSYARNIVNRKRRCIFSASTNDFQFLMDGTDRRFLPIQVTSTIDIGYLKTNRDQIWAEAVYLAKNKEPFYIGTEMVNGEWHDWEASLKRYQQSFIVEDPWAMKILEELETNPPNTIQNGDLMDAIELKPYQRTKQQTNRVSKVCTSLGYTKSKSRPRGWVKNRGNKNA